MARAEKLERDLETMTRMYEAEVRGRRTEPATVRSRPASATDSAPLAAPGSLQSPLVNTFCFVTSTLPLCRPSIIPKVYIRDRA